MPPPYASPWNVASMKRLLLGLLFSLAAAMVGFAPSVLAQTEEIEEPSQPIQIKNEYYRGTVTMILEDTAIDIGGFFQPYQRVDVQIVEGPDRGHTFVYDFQLPRNHKPREKLRVGEDVAVVKVVTDGGEPDYYVAEKYRLPSVLWLFALFFFVVLIFAGWKGISSLFGLMFSLLIIVEFMIPRIMAGSNPVWISLLSGFAILFVSLYVAHGFRKRTTVALIGTVITLLLSAGLSLLAVWFTKVFGMGSEEAITLLQGQLQNINLRGLYLAGVIIGSLGVLDDITTAQAATVDEIHRANPMLDTAELYHRGLSVGREHIASLVNTLALAYVGASLPILLIFTQTDYPLWLIFNSEFLAEEIVRTLVGSATLVIAVPVTTFLAARVFGREKNPPPPSSAGEGAHAGHSH